MSEASVTRKAALWLACFPAGNGAGRDAGIRVRAPHGDGAPAQMTETEKRAQKVQRLTQELNLAPEPAETD